MVRYKDENRTFKRNVEKNLEKKIFKKNRSTVDTIELWKKVVNNENLEK